jgi:uncharacterized protein YbjT (DUF2867 family)
MTASRSALVLGATGLVGSRCLAHLRAADEYASITCLVRRAGSIPTDARVTERIVDFDKLAPEDVGVVSDVFCAIGTTIKKAGSEAAFRKVDFDLPHDVIKLAAARGATRVALVSSVLADSRSSNFYFRVKGELEEALAKLGLRALHVFRPSFLLGDRKESRLGEKVAVAVTRTLSGALVGGLRRFRAVEVDIVGCAMVRAMVGPDPDPPYRVYEHRGMVDLARS